MPASGGFSAFTPSDCGLSEADNDGILDGDETFTTSTSNENLGVHVSVRGTGNVSQAVTLTESAEPALETQAVDSVSRSDPVVFRSSATFERASVRLAYNESTTSDPSDLAIYRLDTAAQTFARVKSDVNPTEGTVTADVKRKRVVNTTPSVQSFS